jgi:hypothetical protein
MNHKDRNCQNAMIFGDFRNRSKHTQTIKTSNKSSVG